MLPLVLLFLVGACLGGFINWAIYSWAWNQRPISPWARLPTGSPLRRDWLDCVPVWGWIRLRREANDHGTLFWLRPLLLDLVVAMGLPALYWWEMSGHLLPEPLRPPVAAMFPSLLATFLAHAVLFGLMLIATFIDVDEKTIPDFVTVPGTLIALAFAVALPQSLLPIMAPPNNLPAPIVVSSPLDWPIWFNGTWGLAIALLCWTGWCYGLLPKTIYTRRGMGRAAAFLLASIARHPLSKWLGVLWAAGMVLLTALWWTLTPTLAWQTLLSSLLGLGFAGGLVWAVRIVSGYVLGVEAMGFGDVTLMAMIGAFLGWQAAMMTFFLAPFTSLLLALGQYVLTGRRDIPFGPFLCSAAAIVVVGWNAAWGGWGPYFELGMFIPYVIAAAIALMGILLACLQVVKRLLGLTPA